MVELAIMREQKERINLHSTLLSLTTTTHSISQQPHQTIPRAVGSEDARAMCEAQETRHVEFGSHHLQHVGQVPSSLRQ